jgi:VWFA-related protein
MRALALFCVLFSAAAASGQYGETITVQRLLVDVRVTDDFGEPMFGLTPADFDVRVDGSPVSVESLTWVDESSGMRIVTSAGGGEPVIQPTPEDGPRERLFVVFVQTDFGRNSVRMQGQMNFTTYAQRFIESLADEDRVAVLSFDSHLKFRLDFTSDKEKVMDAIRQSLSIDMPPPPPIVHSPALASRLDREEMKRAASSEAALHLVANALNPIDGPKNLILMGWGLGERVGRMVMMKHEWRAARRALEAARVTIFALDTTFADYHDLEFGLKVAAKQTGGSYAKTHAFAGQAIERLQRTLSGRYELELRAGATLKPGAHTLEVRMKRRGATILAPTTIASR